jgi:hypothetical protein
VQFEEVGGRKDWDRQSFSASQSRADGKFHAQNLTLERDQKDTGSQIESGEVFANLKVHATADFNDGSPVDAASPEGWSVGLLFVWGGVASRMPSPDESQLVLSG